MKTLFKLALIFCLSSGLLACTHLIYAGAERSGYFVVPKMIQPPPAVLKLEIEANQFIEAWQFRSEKPKAVILQFHGNGQNQSSHFASLYWLVKEGYDLVTFDYRGYGFSTMIETTQQSTIEDSKFMIQWVLAQYPEGTKLILWGQSLGGAVLQRALQEMPTQPRVSLIVYEGSFTSYRDATRSVLRRSWFTTLAYPFVPLLISDSGKAKLESELPSDKIAKATKLVIHAQKDPVIAYDLGEELFGSLREPKFFWSLKSANHIASFHETGFEVRRRKLQKCLQANLEMPLSGKALSLDSLSKNLAEACSYQD